MIFSKTIPKIWAKWIWNKTGGNLSTSESIKRIVSTPSSTKKKNSYIAISIILPQYTPKYL